MRKGDRIWYKYIKTSKWKQAKYHVIRRHQWYDPAEPLRATYCGIIMNINESEENREDNILKEDCCKACWKVSEQVA